MNLKPLTRTRRAPSIPWDEIWGGDVYPEDEVEQYPIPDPYRSTRNICDHGTIRSVCVPCQEDDAWWDHYETCYGMSDEDYEQFEDDLSFVFGPPWDRMSPDNLRQILGYPIRADQTKAARQRRRDSTTRHHARRLRTADIVQNQSPDALACFAGYSRSGEPIEAKPWFAHSRVLVGYHDYSDEERERMARAQLILELQAAADDMGW